MKFKKYLRNIFQTGFDKILNSIQAEGRKFVSSKYTCWLLVKTKYNAVKYWINSVMRIVGKFLSHLSRRGNLMSMCILHQQHSSEHHRVMVRQCNKFCSQVPLM